MVRITALLFAAFSMVITLAQLANAAQSEAGLKQKIRQSLESLLEAQARGIENCENKCDKAFNRFAYQIAVGTNLTTYEFRACVVGCQKCQNELNSNATASPSCFDYCKNFNFQNAGILKGVIEPDKACLGGCVINTCQVICEGGTTDPVQTPQNKQFWWPHGGCSIKTAPYSQYLQYVPFNSPNTGQGGSDVVARCCANAVSLCEYVGSTTSTNFQQLLGKTTEFCNQFVPSGTVSDICAFYRNPVNCGNF